jgi:hypothetical protein
MDRLEERNTFEVCSNVDQVNDKLNQSNPNLHVGLLGNPMDRSSIDADALKYTYGVSQRVKNSQN